MLELTREDLVRAEIGIYARCAADDKAINSCCAVAVLHSPYCQTYNRDMFYTLGINIFFPFLPGDVRV